MKLIFDNEDEMIEYIMKKEYLMDTLQEMIDEAFYGSD